MLIVCCLRGLCVCVSVSLEYTTPSPILADNIRCVKGNVFDSIILIHT